MSALPEYFMDREPQSRDEHARDEGEADDSLHPLQRHWHWIALALLAFCWVAEASMCAARGF